MHLQLSNMSEVRGSQNYSICTRRWVISRHIITASTPCLWMHRLIITCRIIMPMQRRTLHKLIPFNSMQLFCIIHSQCRLELYFIRHLCCLTRQWIISTRPSQQALFQSFLSNSSNSRKWHQTLLIFHR